MTHRFQRIRNGGSLCFCAIIAAIVLTAGCGSSGSNGPASSTGTTSVTTDPNLGRLVNATAPLVTPTYDGSGQATEPVIVFQPNGWHGYNYWLAMAPYTNSDETKENPSILASADGFNWEVPPGLVNPISLPTYSHLADPDIFYDAASDQLWVYYIEAASVTHAWRRTSSDGIHWSTAVDMFQTPNYNFLQPAVEQFGGKYMMWSTNTGTLGSSSASSTVELRNSSDGLKWSAPQTVNISQPGYVIWHVNVKYVSSKSELWMLLSAFPVGKNSGSTVLFFARSTDGMTWTTYNRPILTPVPGSWDSGNIYESTFLYDDATDQLRVWYSARGGPTGTVWHIGYTQTNYTQLLKNLS